MNTYQEMFEQKEPIDSLLTVKINPTSFNCWEDAYWFAKCLYATNDPAYDRKVIDGFDIAFYMGLNIENDKDKFLDATRITAILYFQYNQYALASNKLLMLILNGDEVPVWVNLYFAITQIYTNLSLVAEDPEFYLFSYLDVAITDEEISRRNLIYIDFLNRLVDKKDSGEIESIASITIFEKACDYKLNTEKALLYYKDAYGITAEIPVKVELPEESTDEIEELTNHQTELIAANERIAALEAKVEELYRKLEEKEAEIEAKTNLVEESTEGLIGVNEEPVIPQEEIQIIETEINEVETALEEEPETSSQPIHDAKSLLRTGQRILVYGGQQSKQNQLVMHAKKMFGLTEDCFDFVLDYSKIKGHAERIQPWSDKYAGILIGESPHKTTGTEDYSSLITKFESEEGYPFTVRVMTESHKLKITKTAFGKALWKLLYHLQSQGS